MAVGGSALCHFALIGGAVGWIAFGGVPENDDFSLRTKLGVAKSIQVVGTNFAASRQVGEPLHAGVPDQSGSIWWSWRPPEGAADVLVEVELQGGDPLLGIYQGFAVDRLARVAESKNGTITFAPRPGQDYHFAVSGGSRDAEGVVRLRIQAFTDEDSGAPEPEEETPLLLPEVAIEIEEEEPAPLNYVRTTQNEREALAPDQAAFQSDRNTRAASELAPEEGGLENLPSQDGVDLPFLEMADRDVVDGELADDATIPVAAIEIIQPLLAATESIRSLELEPPLDSELLPEPAVEAAAEPAPASVAETLLDDSPLSESGEMAAAFVGELPVEGEGDTPGEENPEADPDREPELAEASPPERREKTQPEERPPSPLPTPGSEKAEEKDVFQPHTRRNKVAGTISNRGKSAAVDAAETPLGRYTRKVTGAVERSWHFERRRKSDFVSYGSLKVSFVVAASGKPGSLSIIEDDANPIMIDFTLGAILSAEIPPMPKEVRELLGGEPLEITYDVIIY